MGCVIEMLFCDQCGREVERDNIVVIKNEQGEREFLCLECACKSPPEPDRSERTFVDLY